MSDDVSISQRVKWAGSVTITGRDPGNAASYGETNVFGG